MSTMNVLDAAGLTVAVEKPLVPGQALMAASRPVVLASDHSAITVTGTITANVGTGTQPVSGTITANAGTGTFAISAASLPLPTGASTAAKQPALGTAGTASSDVLTVQGIASMTALKVDGSAVTQPISGTVTVTGVATAANQSTLNAAIGSTSDAVLTTGNSGSHSSYLRTIMEQTLSTAASSVKIDQTTDGTTNLVRTSPATTAHALIPAPSTYRLLSAAASTNGANIKSSAGTIKGIQGYNAKASAVYLKLYNKASSPTVGTDTPVKTVYLPATAAFALDFGTGVAFATGISIALTGAGADTDTTALSAGDILALNVDYH